MEQFRHAGCSVWNEEMLGHDVTISRKHGAATFEVWVDVTKIGQRKKFKSATKLALTWVKKKAS
jgi:hypothetical protein